jgi:hypothetical protein
VGHELDLATEGGALAHAWIRPPPSQGYRHGHEARAVVGMPEAEANDVGCQSRNAMGSVRGKEMGLGRRYRDGWLK